MTETQMYCRDARFPFFLRKIGRFSCKGPGMGADGKVKIPTQAGEGGEGVAIILGLRPAGLLRRRLGSTRQDRCDDPLRTSVDYPGTRRVLETPLSTSGAPPSAGKPGAGFVYSVHAPPAWPIREERRQPVIHPEGPIGAHRTASAKACAREAGPRQGRARADKPPKISAAAAALLGSRGAP